MMSALRRGLSHLLQRDLAELDRVVLIDAIERIERSGRAGAARDFRKHLRTFINRQLSLGVIAIDPLAGYRLPAPTKDDVIEAEEHGKSLDEAEILAVWRAASSIGGPFGALVQMGLLTGLWRGELAPLRWDWIDRVGLKITVPGKVMKSGREHAVPITNMIAKLLDETPDRGGGLVFPSEKRLGGATPMSGWSKLLTRLRLESGVAGVGLHDRLALTLSFGAGRPWCAGGDRRSNDRAPALRSGVALQPRRTLGAAAGCGRGVRRLALCSRLANGRRGDGQRRFACAGKEGMTGEGADEGERGAQRRRRGREYINSEAGAASFNAWRGHLRPADKDAVLIAEPATVRDGCVRIHGSQFELGYGDGCADRAAGRIERSKTLRA